MHRVSIHFVLALVAALTGCGGSEGPTPEVSGAAKPSASTAGGESNAASEGQAVGGQQTAAGQTSAGSSAQNATVKAKTSATNLWGAPEAESGRPLPQRPEMSADARDAYQQGIAAQRNGQNAQAVSAFQKALENDKRAYKAAFALGVLADRSGNEGQALRYYQMALQIQADYEDAVQGIVNIYFRREAVGQALSFVEPIARKWERNVRLQAIYADVLVRAGRAEDAEVAARKALKRDERCVPAMISLVKASLTRGRNELAESIIDQAIAIDNKNAELHFLRGKMYQQQERLGDALGYYQKAVTLSPDYAEARIALGIQYLSAGNYSQALAQFETVARLAPTLVAVHLNLGDAYRTIKEWAKAKVEFDKALRLKRDLPEAHFNLALMYMSAGDKFPGLSLMNALNRAVDEFNQYRNSMGSRLQRDDPSEGYLSDLQRTIQREQKRIEREKAQAARAAEAKSEAAPSGEK